jgi:hypothetical protein
MRQPSLFESFNARALQPEQVGRGFIYSPPFAQVAANSNVIVLGPRGSGKTTLLKMLTLPALKSWRRSKNRSKEADDVIDGIDYVALYVPSDFTWYPDFRRPITVKPPKAIDDLLSYSLFRNHVLLAACETLEHMGDSDLAQDKKLSRFAIGADPVRADSLASELARAWEIVIKARGVFGLKRAVAARIREVQHLLTVAAIQPVDVDQLLTTHSHLSRTFFDDLKEFAGIVSHICGKSFQWAACFDEVEIAPDPVKLPIWQSGRSFDSQFLIKLSASPFDSSLEALRGPKTPMAGQDFREVDLSIQSRADIFRFSQKLFSAICTEYKVPPRRPEALLGPSFYDDSFNPTDDYFESADHDALDLGHSLLPSKVGRLSPYGFYQRKFESLAQKDPSFSAYLSGRKVDVNAMNELSEFTQAAFVRKVLSIVVVRDEFLFERGETPGKSVERRFRARKIVPKIYTGAHSLFTICEGNPRWLIGLFRPLVAEFVEGFRRTPVKVISRSLQAKRIERTITTLFTLLSTLRTDPAPGVPTIIDIVERLGDFGFEQVMGERFNPEPATSFRIDQGVTPEIYDAIGRALNQGALVLVPQRPSSQEALHSQSYNPGDIHGRRVRLTYLLAPRYRLPLVLGRPVDISKVLQERDSESTEEQLILSELFNAPIESLQ